MNKYKHQFTVVPASESRETIDYVNKILEKNGALSLPPNLWKRRAFK